MTCHTQIKPSPETRIVDLAAEAKKRGKVILYRPDEIRMKQALNNQQLFAERIK